MPVSHQQSIAIDDSFSSDWPMANILLSQALASAGTYAPRNRGGSYYRVSLTSYPELYHFPS